MMQAKGKDTFLEWLEGEVRGTKGSLSQAQQHWEHLHVRVEQAEKELRLREGQQRELAAQVGVVVALEEGLRQAMMRLSQLEEELARQQQRLADWARLRQGDLEQRSQREADALRRLEELGRGLAIWEGRFAPLEERGRRTQEGLEGLVGGVEDLAGDLKALEGRLLQQAAMAKHLEQELSRVGGEAEALHTENQALSERVQLYSLQERQLEERLADLAQGQGLLQELRERDELRRLEGQRRDERLAALEQGAGVQGESLADVAHRLALLEARGEGLQQRLAAYQEEMEERVSRVWEHMTRLSQLQERHQRRYIDVLEQSLREIKSHASHTAQD